MTVRAKGNQENYFLEIDLKEDMGIDRNLSPIAAKEVGQAIIDTIIDRTRNQQTPLEGGSFAPYSEAYAKKKGVDVNDVNLTLLGDMLNSLHVDSVVDGKITINADNSFENPKLFNHNTGDTVPKREFFGILSNELRQIKSSLRETIEAPANIDRARTTQTTQQRASEAKERSDIEAIAEMIIRGIDFRGN